VWYRDPVLRRFAIPCLAASVLLGGCDAEPVRITLGAPNEAPPTEEGECALDRECATPEPYCHTTLRRCVACLTNQNCGNEICDTSNGRCVKCLSNGDCANDKPYCANDECVECIDQRNCAADGKTCDTAQNKCVDQCGSDDDCTGKDRNRCEPSGRFCVACLEDDDCMGGKSRCSGLRCVECVDNADCSGAKPLCDRAAEQCVECPDDTTCAAECDATVCP